MKAVYKGKDLNEKEKGEIWEILCQCDREFVPPLSARNSSSQKKLDLGVDENALRGEVPTTYFSEMIQQNFILAYEGTADEDTADHSTANENTADAAVKEHEPERVIGFMTFKDHYLCDALSDFGESLYITTVCVRENLRRQGILEAMYLCMESDAAKAWNCTRVSTRTWSTNSAHLHKLNRRGYRQLAVLKNDRGAGIDTVYFGFDIGGFPSEN